MKRWMVAAATVFAAVGGLAAPGLARASSSAWYQTYQANTPGVFRDVAAISKTNIWAVGDLLGKKGNYRPFIQHYAGTGWKTVTIPGSPRFDSTEVSASAASNVWVFGPTSSAAVTSVAYRYNGSRWRKIPVPAETYLGDAVTLGPRNVWAVGTSASLFAPGGSSASVFHWNGSRWRGYSLASGKLVPESISASATNNVWIAGALPRSRDQVVAYRWNGTGWHKAGMLPRVRTDVPGVTALSPSDVWIGWDTATASHVTHWDGHHWHTLAIPGDINTNTSNVVPDGKGGYWFGDAAILTGRTWTSEPAIEISGSLGYVVRIPRTESFLQPASVENPNSAIQKPAIYRFNL